MTECPIIFSGPMVRAILEGRKTQTRRVINPQPRPMPNGRAWIWKRDDGRIIPHGPRSSSFGSEKCMRDSLADPDNGFCPYGQPGDVLWVRESIALDDCGACMHYVADGAPVADGGRAWKWKKKVLSGRFMPRWVCRLLLTVTDVRAQRVQDISEEDAMAEGCRGHAGAPGPDGDEGILPSWEYRRLWNCLNVSRGYPWESNPWVWAISFSVIDALAVVRFTAENAENAER